VKDAPYFSERLNGSLAQGPTAEGPEMDSTNAPSGRASHPAKLRLKARRDHAAHPTRNLTSRNGERMTQPVRVGINGFGRIGRQALRAWLKYHPDDFSIVAVNDPGDPEMLAHLLKFDTVYGPLDVDVSVSESVMRVGGHEVAVSREASPESIDWGRADVSVVIDSTGKFRDREQAAQHLRDSVRKVLISANGRNEDWTVIYGLNHHEYQPGIHHVISAGSCTTNCVVPALKVLHDAFGIERGILNTVHAYTGDQNLVDGSHRDWRRARAAAQNIVPSSTGASAAVAAILPELAGKISGIAMRVPVLTVSVVDLVTQLSRAASVDEVNEAFRVAADGPLRGVLYYEPRPLVSSDFQGHPGSSIFDAGSTNVVDGSLVQTLSWYDNEWGYASRLADLCAMFSERGVE
jgi:glyceraldehyde 3-phosphate dehydrogenase